jgi:hypothetical protein
MVRFGIFAGFGPFIGLLTLIVLGGGFVSHALESFVILVPFALIAGLAPALVTAAVDKMIETWGAKSVRRYLLTAIAGYAATYLLMLENFFEIEPMVPFRYDWGLIGAIPAMICSWITDTVENPV